MSATLGLIAGSGRLPFELARAARRSGRRVAAVALRGVSEEALADDVDELVWLHPGQVGGLLETFRERGVREAVMAGKVSKTLLIAGEADLRLDARALELTAELRDRGDHSILGGIAALLEREGVRVLPQAELVPELLAKPGPLGTAAPNDAQRADLVFGWRIAKALAAQDVGQCVVVKDRAVLAVEAIEGTDEAIRRGGSLGGPGASVVKVAKPGHDPRFDLPAVGPDTLEAARAVGVAVVAFEAESTLVLDRSVLIERADAAGVAVLAVAGQGPESRS